MRNNKILKLIAGLCVGLGVGVCFGAAMQNIFTGLLLGLGVGLCFAVAFTSNGSKENDDDKQ